MNSLLLVAHGSRRDASNREVRQLTDRVRSCAAGRFGFVACAYLELADPDIPAGVDACVAAGATRVTVVPYFLSAGRHVAEDIPAIVAMARERHPGVEIVVAPHLGSARGMAELVLELTSREGPP